MDLHRPTYTDIRKLKRQSWCFSDLSGNPLLHCKPTQSRIQGKVIMKCHRPISLATVTTVSMVTVKLVTARVWAWPLLAPTPPPCSCSALWEWCPQRTQPRQGSGPTLRLPTTSCQGSRGWSGLPAPLCNGLQGAPKTRTTLVDLASFSNQAWSGGT